MTNPKEPPDELVPDPRVWKELGISSMTGWRYTHDQTLGFLKNTNTRSQFP